MTAPLAARGITHRYGGFTAVDGVDLSVPAGRVTALVGHNGAGKSTLFDCLCGTVRPTSGRVFLAGRDVTRLPDHARARLGLARTFQQLAVFPGLTVEENVRVGAEQRRGLTAPGLAAGLIGLPQPGRSSARAATRAALRLLDLGASHRLRAADLPTGTLRRVELARVLASSPTVLLLDEPAAGLDQDEAEALGRVLRALAADGMALLLVEHDLDLVQRVADTVHEMAGGRLLGPGGAEEREGGGEVR
ncbi:ABC transporter ATP-binding protein [Wenjunlia tyrosinilytica]|uniref:ABC transporter ATP-binding protein n=1 Tax=Wenjunlia tyrosinilytica TaxID=1544741 RepID=A0A917ZV40_9ACTN|nr:ABC transporter ATP-binding protein [Wenjunlia tyrosinilytica]